MSGPIKSAGKSNKSSKLAIEYPSCFIIYYDYENTTTKHEVTILVKTM